MEIEKPNYVPCAKPDFYGNEKSFVNQALSSTWISGGSFVELIENEVAKLTNSKFALSTSNGTTAIHAVYLALGIIPGDEVIVPAMTFCATVNAIIHSGVTPVLADVDPRTMNIDPKNIQDKITNKTKAILLVHFAGRPCKMNEITDINGIFSNY